MHVSERYLNLTKQKLEITRLPRDPRAQQNFDFGVSKSDLEPLIGMYSVEWMLFSWSTRGGWLRPGCSTLWALSERNADCRAIRHLARVIFLESTGETLQRHIASVSRPDQRNTPPLRS